MSYLRRIAYLGFYPVQEINISFSFRKATSCIRYPDLYCHGKRMNVS